MSDEGTIDEAKYEAAKTAAHNYFDKNRKIQSLALGTVYLNSDGFMHLIFADRHHKQKRDVKNQLKRFHLLTHTRRILEKMVMYQEYDEQQQTVVVKQQKRKLTESRLVKYWDFIAVIDNKIRVKLVLRQVGNGNIHFWSIIPFWKTRFYRDIQLVELSTGNMEDD